MNKSLHNQPISLSDPLFCVRNLIFAAGCCGTETLSLNHNSGEKEEARNYRIRQSRDDSFPRGSLTPRRHGSIRRKTVGSAGGYG